MPSKTGAIRAGAAFIELFADDTAMQRTLAKVSARLRAFGASVAKIGAGIGAVGAAGLGGFAAAAKGFADAGSVLNDLSLKTGISAQALSELSYAAEQSGTSLNAIETSVRKMQSVITDAADGSKSAAKALAALGLSAADLAGLKPEDQFQRIADAIRAIPDPTRRAAAAVDVLGRSGTVLLPMIGELGELRQKARDLGLTMSNETAKSADALGDSIDTVWSSVKTLRNAIGAGVAGPLTTLAEQFATINAVAIEWAKNNGEVVRMAALTAVGVVALGGAISGLGFTLIGAGLALAGLKSLIAAAGAALAVMVSPAALVIASLAGIAVAVQRLTGAFEPILAEAGRVFGGLKATAVDAFGAISNALAGGDIKAAADVLWAGLQLAWQQGIDPLRKVWNDFRGWFAGAVTNTFYDVLEAAELVWGNLQVVWIEGAAILKSAWANVIGFISQAWNRLQGYLTDQFLELFGLFGELTDEQVAAAKGMNQKDIGESAADIEKQRKESLAAAEQNRQSRRTALAKDVSDALVNLEAERGGANANNAADQVDRVAAATQALADAQAKFREAKDAANAVDPTGKTFKDSGFAAGGFDSAIARLESKLKAGLDATAQSRDRFAMAGTFSGFALGQVGAARSEQLLEKIAENTAKTAETNRKVADALEGEE